MLPQEPYGLRSLLVPLPLLVLASLWVAAFDPPGSGSHCVHCDRTVLSHSLQAGEGGTCRRTPARTPGTQGSCSRIQLTLTRYFGGAYYVLDSVVGTRGK